MCKSGYKILIFSQFFVTKVVCIAFYFSRHVRMMYHVGAIEKISDTFKKILDNNGFDLKFIVRKIHQVTVNESYYLVNFCIPSILPL